MQPERMRRNLESSHGLFFSQRVLLALVESGLARDEAYRLVQRNAMRAWDEELDFRELVRADDDDRRRASTSTPSSTSLRTRATSTPSSTAARARRKGEPVHV